VEATMREFHYFAFPMLIGFYVYLCSDRFVSASIQCMFVVHVLCYPEW